jgi:predicted small lipoprotein YifL
MSRRVRATLSVAVLLAAFGALLGCGQRGPLTLPGSAQPIKRLDPSKAAPAAPAPSAAPAAPAAGADTPAAGATPRPEDDERRTGE